MMIWLRGRSHYRLCKSFKNDSTSTLVLRSSGAMEAHDGEQVATISLAKYMTKK
jgi:hypothetical protein